MARKKDLTKQICDIENADFTVYSKGELEDYSTRLEAIVKELKKVINQYDYNQELKELKKKYNITE